MTLKTLKIGDRTISYETGLNSLPHRMSFNHGVHPMNSASSIMSTDLRPRKVLTPTPRREDDGLGSSDDDETHSSNSGIVGNKTSSCYDEDYEDEGGSNGSSNIFEQDSSPNLDQGRRKVIRPDQALINQLLAFDEEEEENLEDESEDDEENNKKKSSPSGWHKAICKDLANLSSPTSNLQRRHSITICESPTKRKTSCSSISSTTHTNSNHSSNANTPSSRSPRNSRTETNGPITMHYQLNVSEMHSNISRELEANNSESLSTLNLKLDEVAHIRSVLTRAELESLPIDGNVRNDVERGKICFLCMKTRFGLFSRGCKCEMCKQTVCSRCYSKMKIPLEHFNNTPVFALSPSVNPQTSGIASVNCATSGYLASDNSSKPKVKSCILDNTVGSAPNSPQLTKRINQIVPSINTISGALNHQGVTEQTGGPVSLPPSAFQNKYATLPTKNRRMSLMSYRETQRQKLEGSLLTVCTDCKDMVLQVIRASKTTRRMQVVKSMFHNSNPHSMRQQ